MVMLPQAFNAEEAVSKPMNKKFIVPDAKYWMPLPEAPKGE